jgi:hypothetical protein
MRNLAECTQIGGYFIGTGYDGQTIFDRLRDKNEGESIRIMRNGSKIYELTKMYHHSGISHDDTSLGYPINVYQETINKTAMEYLVHFKFLERTMENYGFVLITPAEARSMNLPKGTGMFRDLYVSMEEEIRSNPSRKSEYGNAFNMSEEEKYISFMNRYFVFKKIRSVNVQKIYTSLGVEIKPKETISSLPLKYKATKLKVPKFVINRFKPIVIGEMNPPPEPEQEIEYTSI